MAIAFTAIFQELTQITEEREEFYHTIKELSNDEPYLYVLQREKGTSFLYCLVVVDVVLFFCFLVLLCYLYAYYYYLFRDCISSLGLCLHLHLLDLQMQSVFVGYVNALFYVCFCELHFIRTFYSKKKEKKKTTAL